jgi:hypothetical protein
MRKRRTAGAVLRAAINECYGLNGQMSM